MVLYVLVIIEWSPVPYVLVIIEWSPVPYVPGIIEWSLMYQKLLNGPLCTSNY